MVDILIRCMAAFGLCVFLSQTNIEKPTIYSSTFNYWSENLPVSEVIDVVSQGEVIGDGLADDAPALSKLCSNAVNRTLILPAGHTFLLKSKRIPNIYPGGDPGLMLCTRSLNLRVIANGATLKVDESVPLSAAVFMDRGRNWTWQGGTIIGDRTGLSPSDENVGMALMSNVAFKVTGVHFKGFGGTGAAFAGDWNVGGKLEFNFADGVGFGYDFAFFKDSEIVHSRVVGADTYGKSGVGQIGSSAFSNIYDTYTIPPLKLDTIKAGSSRVSFSVPKGYILVSKQSYPISPIKGIPNGSLIFVLDQYNGEIHDATGMPVKTSASIERGTIMSVQYNFTGISFDESSSFLVKDMEFSFFATGIYQTSGINFIYEKNIAKDNPGRGSAKGIGYLFDYTNGGGASSVGHPVQKVVIDGGGIYNNGAAVDGFGLLIAGSLVNHSDHMRDFIIRNVNFFNNRKTAIGVTLPAITLTEKLGMGGLVIGYSSETKLEINKAYPIMRSSFIPDDQSFTPISENSGFLSKSCLRDFIQGERLYIKTVDNVFLSRSTFGGELQSEAFSPVAKEIITIYSPDSKQ